MWRSTLEGSSQSRVCQISKDEDVYTFFEPELPSEPIGIPRTKISDASKSPGERRPHLKLPAGRSGSTSQNKTQKPLMNSEKRSSNHACWTKRPSPEKSSWNVLDLKGENYFSCAVGRTRTQARYFLQSSAEVVGFLKELAGASVSCSSACG